MTAGVKQALAAVGVGNSPVSPPQRGRGGFGRGGPRGGFAGNRGGGFGAAGANRGNNISSVGGGVEISYDER